MQTKETALSKIKSLVERFDEQKEFYRHHDYNETQTRRDFIDPFFKVLGWDIDNENGYAESYREVIHEDRVKVGSATKAPDYSFRLVGGKRLFFLEAKKPSVVIKSDIQPAYQVRRYGWSAKMPISVITDFEEFAIYDCTQKPKPTDKASNGRIKYMTYQDYIPEFDFIWNTFSKERVLKGSFDKYIKSDKNKRGTSTVDKEFLNSLDIWRKNLALNIALRNKNLLDEDELNFVVQRTIDRIIFLRIAEDRSVESYGQLKDAVSLSFGEVQGGAYKNLLHQFRIADQKYNSGLFDFQKDKISTEVAIDDKVIKGIISDLYYPVCPYEFSVLPVEILGSAYEQFLGKQISLTPGGRATISEKPEVRKAGGVYYTPQYIVDYIVQNTVGKLAPLNPPEGGKQITPKEVSKLKIVDPACGSGSFLIGAYQYLLDWHKDYYIQNGKPSKGTKNNPLTPTGELTTQEKKRILLNNIYGVDLDSNAVEVTRLSLLLKCMEGETKESVEAQTKLFHDRILPTLYNNIKCGNSLIDLDFYDNELDFGEERKIKPFNWQKGFPEVFHRKKPVRDQDFKRQYEKVSKLNDDTDDLLEKYSVHERETEYKTIRGFSIIIGNPPYGALFSTEQLNYFKNRYNTAVWRGESYLMFIEQALKLLKPGGSLGFIIPDTLLNLGFTQPCRELLLRNSKLQEIIGLPTHVFPGATVDTIILLTEKAEYINPFHPSTVWIKSFGKKQAIHSIENPQKEFYIRTQDWFEQNAFNIRVNNFEKQLLSKIETEKKTVKEISDLYYGIKAYQVGKGKPPQTKKIRDEKPFTSEKRLSKKWLPFFDGKNIGRYQLLWKEDNWLNYGEWLAEPRKPAVFEGEKILIRKITGKMLIATYVPKTSYCNTLLYVLKLKDKAYSYKSILAVLNSKLIGWYFRKKFQISDDDTFPQIMIRDILQFPVPFIDKDIERKLDKLASQLLQLNEEKQQQTLPEKISQLQSHIDYCEQRINEIVYDLYGLTEEEIKIIES